MSGETETRQSIIFIKQVLELLPHRYPFILIDRILDFEAGESIKALKNVTMNEPFFQGHFPGEPVMPGVLILEGMAQAGIVLACKSRPELAEGKLAYFAGIDKARFRRMVVPGDQLIFQLKLIKQKSKLIKMSAKAYVDDALAAEAELLATFG